MTRLLPTTVPELLQMRADNSPHAAAYARRVAEGQWQTTMWEDCLREVHHLAARLEELGIRRGDHLVILAHTCAEWHLIEHAGMLAGAVIVGIDPRLSPIQTEQIIRDIQPGVLVCDNRIHNLPCVSKCNVKHIIQLDDHPITHENLGTTSWSELRSRASLGKIDSGFAVKPDDPATLIYTSGTTGQPKAIQYTHRQMMIACQAIHDAFPKLEIGDTTMCWLPLAHLFQRMMNLVAVAQGATIHFVDDPQNVVTCAAEVNPKVFVGVPRFFERLREGIEQNIAKLTPNRQRLVRAAFNVARKRADRCRTPHLPLRIMHYLLDRFVLARIRAVMGHRLEFMVTGSAAIAPSHLEFFRNLGWLLLEAYGVSENTIPMAANRPDEYRFGSVGKPFIQNQIGFDEDGEIFVKGPGVFTGYQGEPYNQNGFTNDGGYRTGDIGYLDEDGYLYLTGRKSEIIKTSTGRKISPSRVEAVYAQCPYLENLIVVGHGRKHLTALCTLKTSRTQDWLRQNGFERDLSHDQLAKHPAVRQLLQEEFRYYEDGLSAYERIAKFAILPRGLSVESGELTTTLKVRRTLIQERYANIIDQLYEDDPQTTSTVNVGRQTEFAFS